MGILTNDIPDGYITGISRRRSHRSPFTREIMYPVAHLYKGTFSNVGQPMCKRGYEVEGDISIWRGNVGPKGICSVCLRRARAGLDPAPWPETDVDGEELT
jgi:hypothetical protein